MINLMHLIVAGLLIVFSVTETVVVKETYHDRNTPYTITSKKKYLELQAEFENKETGEKEYIYKLLEID